MRNSAHRSGEEAAALLGDEVEEEALELTHNVHDDDRLQRHPTLNLVFRLLSSCRQFSLLHFARCFLSAFVPSFLRKASASKLPKSNRKAGTYAHLDGLRGMAALFVFFFHSSYTVWEVRPGYNSRAGYTGILRLPFLRLLFAGDAMVSVFFIVSGFVLSLKPVKLMSARDHESLFRSISSTGFRRGIRLYAPCFASTFIVLLALRLGLYERTRDFATSTTLLPAAHEFHIPRLPTLTEQLWHWCLKCYNFVHVWDWNNIYAGNIGYDIHLWTIPDEYRCSILLILTQLIIARASSRKRIVALSSLVAFAASWGRWEMMCFWSGAVLAELEVLWPSPVQADSALTLESCEKKGKPATGGRDIGWLALFTTALYFLSYPDNGAERTYGYGVLFSLVPSSFGQTNRFWQAIGAFLAALSINRTTILQRVFVCRPIKYLGKISFALYLMHGLVLHTVQYTLLPMMWKMTGRNTPANIALGWLMSQTLVIATVIYAADIFWMNVDLPSNQLCHWLEGLFFDKT